MLVTKVVSTQCFFKYLSASNWTSYDAKLPLFHGEGAVLESEIGADRIPLDAHTPGCNSHILVLMHLSASQLPTQQKSLEIAKVTEPLLGQSY